MVSRTKSGDRLEYAVEGERITLGAHLGLRPLKGVLASGKGKGMTFAEIRDGAARAGRRKNRQDKAKSDGLGER